MGADILEARNLKTFFSLPEGVLRAVDGVSFRIREGESLGLVGESGCGKSVTALSLMRLVPDPPGKILEGEIFFKGSDLMKLPEKEMRKIRGSRISMVFQEPATSMNPSYTIGNQMKEVIRFHQGGKGSRVEEKALEVLRDVQIPDPRRVLSQYPHELSGGMLQRVMIAMALSCEPVLMICDEPTTALDVSTQAQIIQLLGDLRERRRMSLLFITHDLGVLSWVCTSAAVMYAGKIVEHGAINQVLKDPIHPYTRALIGATPRMDRDMDRLKVISGTVPNLVDLPPGCTFWPRCPLSRKACREEAPVLNDRGDGHHAACHFC
ncbi:MAG: ABC transporter ATP-binding protein [Deltaproteobacteria bacterium]|nr:ABC transporter ATP-binding protein [Deltaproteobacteria bacterium]